MTPAVSLGTANQAGTRPAAPGLSERGGSKWKVGRPGSAKRRAARGGGRSAPEGRPDHDAGRADKTHAGIGGVKAVIWLTRADFDLEPAKVGAMIGAARESLNEKMAKARVNVGLPK